MNRQSCFGQSSGIQALYETLVSRLEAPVPQSYTAKLFNDTTLLHGKIMEEADELCRAETKDDIAWETADLLYFALAKCAKNGVTLSDIERHLDMRSKKASASYRLLLMN